MHHRDQPVVSRVLQQVQPAAAAASSAVDEAAREWPHVSPAAAAAAVAAAAFPVLRRWRAVCDGRLGIDREAPYTDDDEVVPIAAAVVAVVPWEEVDALLDELAAHAMVPLDSHGN